MYMPILLLPREITIFITPQKRNLFLLVNGYNDINRGFEVT